ncbi:MAG TPA: energy transducer TonB [Candidatus Acidoferrum sp.]|nr:energy transducer TonB [Candidatus Acidoferrum sp.]
MFRDMGIGGVARQIIPGVFVSLMLVTAPSLRAQYEPSDLRLAAKEVAKEVAKAHLGSIAVTDFVSLTGEQSVPGHYMAEEFAWSLVQSNKRLTIVEPSTVTAALSSAHLSLKDLTVADQTSRINSALHADTIVSGTVDILAEHYAVHIEVRNANDGKLLLSRDQKVKRPAYVDLLMTLDPSGKAGRIARAGEDGVGVPQCIHCPGPSLPKDLFHAPTTAGVKMEVIIDTEGRVARILVYRSGNDALEASAVYEIEKWRFKPALDKSGRPAAVIVPVFITFHVNECRVADAYRAVPQFLRSLLGKRKAFAAGAEQCRRISLVRGAAGERGRSGRIALFRRRSACSLRDRGRDFAEQF